MQHAAWSLRLIATVAAVLAVLGFRPGALGAVRQSFELRVASPAWVVTSGGSRQLVYELHLTNFAREALTLETLVVRDADVGRDLAVLANAALAGRLARVGVAPGGTPDSATIAAGSRAVVYLEVPLPPGPAPRAIRHRLQFAPEADTATREWVEGPVVPASPVPPRVIGPPVRGGPWAAVHHPAWPRGHRRVIYTLDGQARIPGRFAIDWIRLDDEGRSATGDADVVANAIGYGVEAIAVADATVAATRDDIAESPTISGWRTHALEDAAGNFVALDLGEGWFAFYEHLKPGSIRVTRGQRVRRGDVVGGLGFTGDSTGPHLHFHLADASSPLAAEGRPFAIEAFEVRGHYPDIAALGRARWVPADGSLTRRAETPGPNVVVTFF